MKKAILFSILAIVVAAGIVLGGAGCPGKDITSNEHALGEIPVSDEDYESDMITFIEFDTFSQAQKSSIEEKSESILRSSAELSEYWDQLHPNNEIIPPLPDVFFDEEMVIAVTMGQSGGGANIYVKSIKESTDKIEVEIIEEQLASECAQPSVITNPYHMVIVQKSDKEIVFTREQVVKDCE